MPDTSTACSWVLLFNNLLAVLVSGRSLDNAFCYHCPPTARLAGLTEFFSWFFLHILTHAAGLMHRSSPAVNAVNVTVTELPGMYHCRSRGANYRLLYGIRKAGWA